MGGNAVLKIIPFALIAALLLLLNSVARALPPPCVGVQPAFGVKGDTIDITIVGSDTHFDDTSQVSFSCQGITVNSVTANSANRITANITIACDALSGYCDVVITTGSKTIDCIFEIMTLLGPPCDDMEITPATARIGETLDVDIGLPNADVRGIKNLQVQFQCTGITVNSVTATAYSTARVNISVANNAAPCSGRIQLSGQEGLCRVLSCGEFSIQEKLPCTSTVSPATLRAGFLLPRWYFISISGTIFGFSSESTVEIEEVRFINIASVSAAGDEINAWVVIPPRFIIGTGARQVKITTGDEICTGALEIE